MSKYLALQNKALHQGMYLAYVTIHTTPGATPHRYTTNGHVAVRGELDEVKTIKNQEDRRGEDHEVVMNFTGMKEVELEPLDDTVKAGEHEYQSLYVKYIIARYPVADWRQSEDKLIALDTSNNILGIIAPIIKPKEVTYEKLEDNKPKHHKQQSGNA